MRWLRIIHIICKIEDNFLFYRNRQSILETSSLGSIGALNTIGDESEAPLASVEDLNDQIYDLDDPSETYFDESNDATKSLLNRCKLDNNISVMVKQPDKGNFNSSSINANVNNVSHGKETTTDQLEKGTPKVGSISLDLYSRYIHAGASIFGIAILFISTIMCHGLLRFADAWLGVWTSNERLNQMRNLSFLINEVNEDDKIHSLNKTEKVIEEFNSINYYYLIVFSSTVLAIIISTYLMIHRFFITCITASKNLHDQMFTR